MSRLIEEVKRAAPGLGTNAAAREAVDAVFAAVTTVTNSGDKVRVHGFGTFEKKHRAGRKGRNPKTGEPVTIAPREQLTFKASK